MLSLQAGDASLVLSPELGGSIVGWTLGPVPLLRRPRAEAIMPGSVHGLGCFPLVPFSNRIAHGRFRWDQQDYAITRNFGDHPHAIHGCAWQMPWHVAAVSHRSATLVLQHGSRDGDLQSWPFPFDAEQNISLSPDALVISLTVTNRHHGSAPAGLGLHPYFPRSPGCTLRFAADAVWLNDETILPQRRIAVPTEWNHVNGLPVGAAALDNCFAGWDQCATIVWPQHNLGLTIEADALFSHLIVFTPPGADYFCAEPVSHMNDAIHWQDDATDHGLRSLAPGETLRGEVSFRITTGG